MIDEGTHRARAKSAEFGYTKGGGEQVAVLFTLLDADGGETAQSITWFGFFTENTEKRTVESLRHCGWTGTDITNLVGLGSADVDLVVVHEEYNDKWSAKVRWVNRPGGGAVKLERPMDEAQKRLFAARFKNLAASVPAVPTSQPPKANGSKPPAQPQTQRHPNAPGNTDDDLPF